MVGGVISDHVATAARMGLGLVTAVECTGWGLMSSTGAQPPMR
jgi:hypothetical protein